MLFSALLAAIVAMAGPSGPGASTPHLATANDGSLLMSWMETAGGKKHALKLATMRNGRWSAPRTIVVRDDFFANWADFPSVIMDARGVLYAHWLQKSGAGTYAYDVVVTSSADGGNTWRVPRVLHGDGKQTEHGFVSMAPLDAAGGVAVTWLDGRNMSAPMHGHDSGAMTLRFAHLDRNLNVRNEQELDARVCECCTTAMTMTAQGPLIAYRDRSNDEIRDISFVRSAAGRWSAPRALHADGWKIPGCPVNGPQLASRGNAVAAAWFAAPDNKPRVLVAFSRDGVRFGAPVRIDGGKPIGRVDVQLARDGSALVTWIENDSILLRRVYPNRNPGPPVTIARTTSARASGFPRIALLGAHLYVAWTDATEKRVRLARVDVP